MKKIVLIGLVALLSLSSCNLQPVNVTNNNDTPTQVHKAGQETVMNPFKQVNVAGQFDVFYEYGEAYVVRVEGTAKQLAKMTIYVEDEELCLDVTDYHWPADKNLFDGLKVFVSSPNIEQLSITSLGSLIVPSALKADNLKLLIDGMGDITISQLTCNDLNISIEGDGNVATGSIRANNVLVEVEGMGDIEIDGLTCKKVTNKIAGMGNTKYSNLNVGNVKTEIAGMGDVILQGTAGSHEESISGMGKVDVSGLTIVTDSIP